MFRLTLHVLLLSILFGIAKSSPLNLTKAPSLQDLLQSFSLPLNVTTSNIPPADAAWPPFPFVIPDILFTPRRPEWISFASGGADFTVGERNILTAMISEIANGYSRTDPKTRAYSITYYDNPVYFELSEPTLTVVDCVRALLIVNNLVGPHGWGARELDFQVGIGTNYDAAQGRFVIRLQREPPTMTAVETS
ncbi:hypothetical protein MMC28_010626 [Mycoblastus sanguinarius]|nr:hypothetical protein [Mycoblastus sanguinarius]